MDLVAHVTNPPLAEAMPLRPAPRSRDWMDRSRERFAYRCTPLVVANQHGWEVLLNEAVEATWDGRPEPDGVQVAFGGQGLHAARGHFGEGVLTFSLPYLFRTPPGWNLWVKGPANAPKDGISALEGMAETDWSPATFTMNWRFTRPCKVRFEAGEPVCMLVPVPRGALEAFVPRLEPLQGSLREAFEAWSASRERFLGDLKVEGSEAQRERWQKDYAQQAQATGLRLREFRGLADPGAEGKK